MRLTVTAPDRAGVTLAVAFDGGAVHAAQRVGGSSPSLQARGTVQSGARAAALFDLTLADAPGDTLGTVTLTARRRGGGVEAWTVPLPVALVNPLPDAGDRRHLLIAAVGASVGEQLGADPSAWDVLADGTAAPGSDVAALLEVIGAVRGSGSPIVWGP